MAEPVPRLLVAMQTVTLTRRDFIARTALGAVATAFLVKPNGILALPLDTAPAVIAVYALLAAIVWYSRRTGRGSGDRDAPGRGPRLGESAPSAPEPSSSLNHRSRPPAGSSALRSETFNLRRTIYIMRR